MIKNLIFDFGKVLVDYDFDQFFNRYFTDEKKRDAAISLLTTEELQSTLDREEKPFDETMQDLISKHTEYKDEIETFFTRYPDIIIGEIPGMRQLMTQLKAEGYKLYGLSNWSKKVYLTMEQYKEIFGLLDGYVISSEEKLIKPEPAIYQRLFQKFGIKPEECVFADDKMENIEGSRSQGMEAILFHNAEQYEKELRTLLANNK